MNNTLNILHKLDQTKIFKGLSTAAIEYIRKNGLWMPVTNYILDVSAEISNSTCQLYVDSPKHTNYLTFIIECNEFLTGAVYGHVDASAINVEGYLHQYALEGGELIFETVQAVHNGVLFLALTDAQSSFTIGWEEYEIEGILKIIDRS